MDLTKLKKTELLIKCQELGFTKYKSMNKNDLINILTNNNNNMSNDKKHLKPLVKWSGGKSDEIKLFELKNGQFISDISLPSVGTVSIGGPKRH